MVTDEIENLSDQQQQAFWQEYNRRKKSVGLAYLFWALLGFHYIYLRKWGLAAALWISSFAIVGLIWWIIDAFRMPKIVADYNKDVSVEVMNNLKAISS